MRPFMALWLAGAVAASAATCFAAEVEGTLAIGGKPVAVKHVVAQLHDNAEGALRRPLRIVVADRPIPEGAIEGIGEIAATQLALEGKLRGVLLRIDPAKPYEASLIILDKPDEPQRGLTSLVIGSVQEPAISALKLSPTQVALAAARPASPANAVDVVFSLRIDTPLTREPPISADLRGDAVRASPHWRAAAAYAEAIGKGDLTATRRLQSRALNDRTDQLAAGASPAAMTARLKQIAPTMRAQLAKVHRIVERGGRRAALMIDENARITMVKESGEWKTGD
jgi:hypothetical protein